MLRVNARASRRKTVAGRRLPGRVVAPEPVIEVQYAVSRAGVPHPATLRRWAKAALQQSVDVTPAFVRRRPVSLTLRVVGAAEGRRLNLRWRGKDKTTNVLSFPSGSLPGEWEDAEPLGDIVICAPVIRREAGQQFKAPAAHWAHMVIHGTLHLLGYDHEVARDAEVMEQLERQVLAGLGFSDPYLLKDAKRR